jgi:hypothetical protein
MGLQWAAQTVETSALSVAAWSVYEMAWQKEWLMEPRWGLQTVKLSVLRTVRPWALLTELLSGSLKALPTVWRLALHWDWLSAPTMVSQLESPLVQT